MATDGDLLERALARGLRREEDALFIVRRSSLSVIVAGRRIFLGSCAVAEGRLADGLYEVSGGPSRWVLRGVDAPSELVLEATVELPSRPARILALVAEDDPAGHGHP